VKRGDIYEYTIGSRATFAVVLGAGTPSPPVAVMVPTYFDLL
jgi:hypothetical protein